MKDLWRLRFSFFHRTRDGSYWKNSNQKQRWLAAVLLDIEPRLYKVQGYKYLPRLREAIVKELKLNLQTINYADAA